MSDYNKKIVIIGGGTFSHVRSHLSIAAPAFGETARQLASILSSGDFPHKMQVDLRLTKMANHTSDLVTNEDVSRLVDSLVADSQTQIIFFNAAMCDFNGTIGDVPSGKYAARLKTKEGNQTMVLTPAEKVIKKIRKYRKDILLVGFKTTSGATEDEQYIAGLELMKSTSCNLVLANDLVTRTNMIITPEEARYHVSTDRTYVLRNLVDMALLRSHLKFTRSTVVSADPVSWNSDEVPANLRSVVNWCIEEGAYKEFRGATVGHFACKVSDTEFLTSRRRVNFNQMAEVGLVRVKTDGPDSVIAYGSKPSVGGQSQRIIFREHEGMDCIVHFHCPLREDARDSIPVRSQRQVECGSFECGQNTSDGLCQVGNLKAVMLDNHGPNIVFSRNIDPNEVIDFIQANFDLRGKTGGPVSLV